MSTTDEPEDKQASTQSQSHAVVESAMFEKPEAGTASKNWIYRGPQAEEQAQDQYRKAESSAVVDDDDDNANVTTNTDDDDKLTDNSINNEENSEVKKSDNGEQLSDAGTAADLTTASSREAMAFQIQREFTQEIQQSNSHEDKKKAADFLTKYTKILKFVQEFTKGMTPEEKKDFMDISTAPEEHFRKIVLSKLFMQYSPTLRGRKGSNEQSLSDNKNQADGEKAVYRVTIPKQLKEGDIFAIKLPDGTQKRIQIPKGAKGGEVLQIIVKKNNKKPTSTGTDIPPANKSEMEAFKKKISKKKKTKIKKNKQSSGSNDTVKKIVLLTGSVAGFCLGAFLINSGLEKLRTSK